MSTKTGQPSSPYVYGLDIARFLIPASLVTLAMVMAFSVFSCVLLGLYLVAGAGVYIPAKALMAVAGAALALYVVHRALPLLRSRFERLAGAGQLWAMAVVIGIALRLATWLSSLPVEQVNDGLHYLELANRLYAHQSYELNGFAFWPPGTPFVYTAFMWIVGQVSWIAVIVNCLFFLLTAVSVRSICVSLKLAPGHAGIAVALLAIWPALFLTAAQVSKETLLVGMLPAVLALSLARRLWPSLCAGLLAGLTILTQPSLMLLPLFVAAALLAAQLPLKGIVLRMGLLLAGAMLVIAPWTYRNFQVFDEFVPVSTNAGLVLHAGNQPAMVKPLGEVGGFLEPAVPATPLKNDALLSRWHKAEAFRFIAGNKTAFARLVWNRIVITMGDDSDSAYRSLRLTGKISDKAYIVFKALSNAYWMLLAAVLGLTCWSIRNAPEAHRIAPLAILAAGVTVYLMAVHGMAEGGGRHHMAWSWLYALIVSTGLLRLREEGNRQPVATPHFSRIPALQD